MSSSIARRYARAFFGFAEESKAIDKVYADILVIQKAINKSNELREFLSNPLIPKDQQRKILDTLFKKHIKEETMKCLHFLVSKEKLSSLSNILIHFEWQYQRHKNVKKAKITSSCPMPKKLVDAVCAKLRKFFNCDIEPEVAVDPKILGGFRVNVDDIVFDLTVSKQLNNYRRSVILA